MGYSVYAIVRKKIAEDCGMSCSYCGREVKIGFDANDLLATIDHKIPLSRGGTWKRNNLTCACRRCNNEKADMLVDEFMNKRNAYTVT